ncbi:Zinc finger, CCCH-type [Sesbania bispinosa]|nr:Zinc finger, CCCH-type [Sesbania bispinosa]
MLVKLFLSEDCPSKVSQKSQDHLQVKTSSMLPWSTNEYDDDLPPGFEGNHFLSQPKAVLSDISQIRWKCPPLFAFSNHWRVAAGEESGEKNNQKLREMRVLEAVYPRPSAIPPSPSVSFEVGAEDYDDSLTPLIPIIPIEEEESMDINGVAVTKPVDIPNNLQSQCKASSASVPSPVCGKPVPGISPSSEADLAAASTVITAIMKSNEQGSLIDMDLLLKIFNDPTMIGKLINEHRTAASPVSASSNNVTVPTSESKSVTLSVPLSRPKPEVAASGTTPIRTVGLLPVSGPKQATPSESFLPPTPDKQVIPPVSVSASTFDKPTTPSLPLFRPVSGKSAESYSVTLHQPPSPTPSTPMPHMHKPGNKNIPHLSNGVMPTLNTQSPQQDTVLSSGVKRAASLALPSGSVNLHAVANQVLSTASTVPHQPGTGSGSGSAFGVKEANYYKNLIRQHGADKQDVQDSQIGIRHNNFQDMKSVHNIIKPGEVIFKTQKPCIYFKSSRGCRNGSNCPYQHDMSAPLGASNVLVAQSAKRVKLAPEIKSWI